MLFMDVGASHLPPLPAPAAMTLSVALNYRMADDLSFATVRAQNLLSNWGKPLVLSHRRFRTHNKSL